MADVTLPPLPEENEDPWYSKRQAFDAAVKQQLEGPLSESELSATIGDALARVDIRSFIQEGESLVGDDSGVGNNSAIIQRAVDALNALFVVDGKPRQIYFPDGTYRLARTGAFGSSGYAVVWKSGAGIATSSRRGVRFMTPPDASAFLAADNPAVENLSHVYCDPHVVDGALHTLATYTSKYKGWFIQGLADSLFDDILIENTWSTGFGCDYLQRTIVTGVARNCGRGLKELGIDPLTTSGATGFGIGTGRFEVEDFVLDVEAYDCGFHGVFIETQGIEPYEFSRGGRVKALCVGNFVGFRDCGADGLVAEINAYDNTYAGVLHDKTILNDGAGVNGHISGKWERNGSADIAESGNLVIGHAPYGAYYFGGAGSTARKSVRHGVTTDAGAGKWIGPGITIDLAANDNALDGVRINAPAGGESVVQLHIKGQARENGLNGVVIAAPTDLLRLDVDCASIQGQQQYGLRMLAGATRAVSSADLRGAGVQGYTEDTPITWDRDTMLGKTDGFGSPTLADYFIGDAGDMQGRTASDGSSTASWSRASGSDLVMGLSSNAAYMPGAKVLSGSGNGIYFLTAGADGRVQARLKHINSTPNARRAGLVFRVLDSSNYWRISVRPASGQYNLALQKVVAGVATTVSTFSRPPQAGDLLAAEFDGGSISWYVNGSLVGTVTDSAFQANTRVGLLGDSADNITTWEQFRFWPL